MSDQRDARALARNVLASMDALLSIVQGGNALEALVDAREALANFANQKDQPQDDRALTVQLPVMGGVTLIRGARSFTIDDEDLELVREAINTRKREIRKRERRESKSK
jgi:hypothetical protein